MNTHSPLQEQVIEAARHAIKNEPWYRGVCVSYIPSDAEIMTRGFQESVDQIICETEFHDATGFRPVLDEANG